MDKAYLEELKSNNQLPSFLHEDAVRRKRWEHLTDDLSDYQRLALETVLDNTAKWIMQETTTTGDIGTFTTYAFPLIRRIMPSLFANELVSVQPMPMPTGKVFYLDFKYGSDLAMTNSNAITAGERVDLQDNFNPLYTGGYVRGDYLGVGDGTNETFEFTYADVDDTSVVVFVDGEVVDPDAYSITGDDTVDFNSAPAEGAVVTANYQIDLYLGEGEYPREIDFEITSDSVDAEARRLQAEWTIEAQQDLMAYHGLGAESEVMAVVQRQVTREIDRQIIEHLDWAARHANGGGNVSWSGTIAPDYNGSQREWNLTLYDAIVDANQLIYDKRMVNANWIVCGSNAATRLEKLEGFTEVHRDWAMTGMGMERFGVLKNRFNVYKDPWFPTDQMLIGYKGQGMFETGYVFAPYELLYVTPLIVDTNMKAKRGIMSRYGRKLVDPGYYATISIS